MAPSEKKRADAGDLIKVFCRECQKLTPIKVFGS